MSGFSSSGGGHNYGAAATSRPGYQGHAARPGVREYRDDPGGYQAGGAGYGDFQEMCDKISSDIFQINTNATTLDRAWKQIGTNKDNMKLRDRLHQTEQATNRVITDTAAAFKHLANISRGVPKAQKVQCERLRNEFKEAAQRYNLIQTKVAERVRAVPSLPSAKAPPRGDTDLIGWGEATDNDQARLIDEQRQQQLQAQEQVVESDLQIIQEREERIRQLEADILDINEIFKDLGALVYEQGEQIDSIEANVETAANQVEAGRDELQKAAYYQSKARKKKCCIIVTLTIIAAVIIIIIVVAVKTK